MNLYLPLIFQFFNSIQFCLNHLISILTAYQVAIKTIYLEDGVASNVPIEEFLILKECKSEFITTCFGGYKKSGYLWVCFVTTINNTKKRIKYYSKV